MKNLPPPRPRLLIVDDTMTNVEILLNALEADYDVRFATSGQEALELIASAELPDLLLLDIMMPGIDGYEVCKRLKSDPKTSDIAVIFVTAMDSSLSETQGLALGADDYITKPINIDITRLRISNLLERKHQARELELALTCSRQGLWEWDLGQNTVRLDPRWGQTLGYAPGEMTRTTYTWSRLLHPDDFLLLLAASDQHFSGQQDAIDVEVRMRNHDDAFSWMHLLGRGILRDARGMPIRVLGTYMDISARKHQEAEILESQTRIATLIASIPDAVMTFDTSGLLTDLHLPADQSHLLTNEVWQGLQYAELFPRPLAVAIEAATLAAFDDASPQTEECELDPEGEGHFYSVTVSRLADSKDWPTGFIAVIRDITRMRVAEDELRRMAFHDPLTQLPNRRQLDQRLRRIEDGIPGHQRHVALMMIDLDKFKAINDELGHEIGDLLLIEVGKRTQAEIRGNDIVSRHGGDEFVVLLEDLGDNEEQARDIAQRIADKIYASLNQPYLLGQHKLNVSASIGIRVFASQGMDALQMLKEADQAMYAEKARNR